MKRSELHHWLPKADLTRGRKRVSPKTASVVDSPVPRTPPVVKTETTPLGVSFLLTFMSFVQARMAASSSSESLISECLKDDTMDSVVSLLIMLHLSIALAVGCRFGRVTATFRVSACCLQWTKTSGASSSQRQYAKSRS